MRTRFVPSIVWDLVYSNDFVKSLQDKSGNFFEAVESAKNERHAGSYDPRMLFDEMKITGGRRKLDL